jgi:hypothetical protein
MPQWMLGPYRSAVQWAVPAMLALLAAAAVGRGDDAGWA